MRAVKKKNWRRPGDPKLLAGAAARSVIVSILLNADLRRMAWVRASNLWFGGPGV